MPVYPYEGLYLGLLNVYHADPLEAGFHKLKGYVDGGLTYSYDGWRFNRTFREPFLPRNERGEPGGGGVYPSTLLVDAERRRAHLLRRRPGRPLPDPRGDGRRAAAAHAAPGRLLLPLRRRRRRVACITRRLRFPGPDLSLNVRAPYGRVRVQLCEHDGTPLPGYTFDECLPFTGDDLFYRPAWREGRRAGALVGDPQRQIKLGVEVLHGDVYAIRGDFDLVVAGPPPARP